MMLENVEVERMNEKLTMNEMQRIVDQYIGQFKEGYFSPLALLARMTEELGELAREINHYHGEKPKKHTEAERTVEEEMGDVLFVLICFANSLDIQLDEAFERVMEKFNTRDKDRWTRIEEEN
jgi:NTP pyrophosphatase (non-canonical NTP hydrolase)